MRILALERDVPGTTAAACNPFLRAEAERAWELYQDGILRELYFRADRAAAVLILECDGLETARQALQTLPLVARGLIVFDLVPLAPYPGFARLFGSGPGEHP